MLFGEFPEVWEIFRGWPGCPFLLVCPFFWVADKTLGSPGRGRHTIVDADHNDHHRFCIDEYIYIYIYINDPNQEAHQLTARGNIVSNLCVYGSAFGFSTCGYTVPEIDRNRSYLRSTWFRVFGSCYWTLSLGCVWSVAWGRQVSQKRLQSLFCCDCSNFNSQGF